MCAVDKAKLAVKTPQHTTSGAHHLKWAAMRLQESQQMAMVQIW